MVDSPSPSSLPVVVIRSKSLLSGDIPYIDNVASVVVSSSSAALSRVSDDGVDVGAPRLDDEENKKDDDVVVARRATSSLEEGDLIDEKDDVFSSNAWRGNEKPMLDESAERRGYVSIVNSLTKEERSLIPDVNMAVRYFRGEKGNVANAVRKMKATLAWRREWNVDVIRTCFDENDDDENDEAGPRKELRATMSLENATGKMYARGYDRSGRALVYFKPGKENVSSSVNNMKHMVYHLERAAACTARRSGLSKSVIVFDFTGYKLSNAPPLWITKLTVSILQNHYPERLHKFYICNPPFIFRGFWKVISPFVDPTTKAKIAFCDSKGGGAKILENDIGLDILEGGVGGTRTDLRPYDSQEYLTGPYEYTFDGKSD